MLGEIKKYSGECGGTINTACKLITPLFLHIIYSTTLVSPKCNSVLLLFYSLMSAATQNRVPYIITFNEFQLFK